MRFFSLQTYFSFQFDSIPVPPTLKSHLQSLLSSSNAKILEKFSSNHSIQKKHKIHVKKLQLSESEIQENIRKKKLQVAIESKKNLEQKLNFVSQNIESFLKNNNSQKKSQKEIFFEEKRKAEDFVKEIKKFSQMRKESEKFLETQTEKLKRKAKVLEEQDLILAEKMKEKREINRKLEMEKLREKKNLRDREMQEIKKAQNSHSVILEKPLYLKLEESFKRDVELPELERQKEELIKKKEFYKSIQPESFQQHLKEYKSVKQHLLLKLENDRKSKYLDSLNRSFSVNNSIWTLKVIEEDQKAEDERVRKIQEKRNLVERRIKYNEIVKKLRPQNKQDVKAVSTANKSELSGNKSGKKLNGSVSVGSYKWKPHKFPLNPMIPQAKQPREPKELKYLEERRNNKSSSPENIKNLTGFIEKGLSEGLVGEKELKKVFKSANRLEEIVRKKELLFENKPLSMSLIQQTESVDNLLLSSIKAKLHILGNI